jgi:ketosteroid isomerase-like protein
VRLGRVVKTEEAIVASNKEIIEEGYANFAKGDVPAVLAMMDPEIEWTEAEGFPLYNGTLVGPQAIVDGVFMRLGEIGDNFSVNAHEFVADGDTVAVLGTYSWNHKVSGEPAEVKMVHVWNLDGGKLTRFQQHVDTARVRELIA